MAYERNDEEGHRKSSPELERGRNLGRGEALQVAGSESFQGKKVQKTLKVTKEKEENLTQPDEEKGKKI